MTAGLPADASAPRHPEPPDPNSTRNALVVVLLFLLASVVAIGGGVVYYRGEAAEIYDDASRQLQLISDLKLQQLAQWRRERLGDADVLSRRNAQSNPTIHALLSPDDDVSRQNVRAWLRSYLTAYNEYDRAFLLAADGSVRIAEPTAGEPPSVTLVREARAAMAARAPRILDFYQDEQDNGPHLALIVPVLDGLTDDRPVGAVVLRIDPERFIYPVLEIEESSSETGETELVRRDGDAVVFLNKLRFAEQSALTLREPTTDPNRLAAKVVNGQTGTARGIDYRNHAVLGFISPVPSSPWLLITRIDIDELDQGLHRHLGPVTTGVALLLLSVGASLLLWRHDQRARTYRRQAELSTALEESEERLRLALASASQGLYDFDLRTGNAVVSPEYAAMLGHDAATFTETLESWRKRVHPDDVEAASNELEAYLAGHAPAYHAEFRLRTKGGGWKWILSVGRIVSRDADARPKRMIGTHTDITQLKWAQEGQTRAAAQLRNLLASSPTVIYSVQVNDAQLRPVAVSENVERILGYTPHEVMQVDFWAGHVHPEDRDRALATVASLANDDDVTHEYRFRAADGRYIWVQDRLTVVRRGAGGAPLEIIGAWNDITNRHDAAQALRRSEERLRLAMISARQGLWDLHLESGETLTSPEYAVLLGYDPADFVETASSWNERVHPDDLARCQQAFDDYIAGRRPDYEVELRQQARDGSWTWIHSIGRVIERTGDGRPVRMLGIHTDITSRKRAELRAARLSRLYLTLSRCNEAIARSSSEAELLPRICRAAVEEGGFELAWVGIVDRETSRVNVAASHGTGLEYLDGIEISVDPDSPLSHGPAGIAIRENRPCWVEDYQETDINAPWRDRVREFGWRGVAAVPLTRGGEAVGVLCIYSRSAGGFEPDSRRLLSEMAADISFALDVFAGEGRRAQAEARLRQSEARYRTLFAESGIPMLLIDSSTGNIADANLAAAAFYGWDVATLRRMHIGTINSMEPEPLRELIQTIALVPRGRFSFKHRLASGELRDVEAFTARVMVEDQPRTLSIVTDVTSQRVAEAALREKEHQLVEAQRLAHVGSWTMGPGRDAWSAEMFRLFGLPEGSPIPPMDEFRRMVHPDDFPLLQRTLEANFRGETTPDIEYRLRLHDGRLRYMSAHGELRHDPVSGPYVAGTTQDITDRRSAEQAVRHSEERLRLALAAGRLGFWDFDVEAGKAAVSVPDPDRYGFGSTVAAQTFEEFTGQVHPADRARVAEAFASYVSGASDTYDVEVRLEVKPGEYRWTQSTGQVVTRAADGRPLRLTGVIRDTTEQRAAEEQLRVKDHAIESSLNALAIADLEGRLTYVNRAFLDLWEEPRIEVVLGRNPVEFFHEPGPAAAVMRALAENGHWTGELRAVTSSGRLLDLLVAAVLVEAQGQPLCMVASFVDITERKRAERTVQASLAEKEALLKEVHHRVKNNLQVISSLLRLELGRSVEPGVKTVLGEMQNRVISMALLHETLYRSDNLARVDLSTYLTRLVNQLFRSSAPASGRVTLHAELDPASVELDQAVPCGLLVTELVSNSLKHAFPDNRAGDVRITLEQVGQGPALRLTVSDNGAGLPGDFDERREHSLGLQLVSDLARQLRGTLDIARAPGATFTLTFTPRTTTHAA